MLKNSIKSDNTRRFSDYIINESILLVKSKKDSECQNYGLFEITEESESSCLMPYHSKQVADIIEIYFGGRKNINNILDATASIGCDTINFRSRFGAKCISLESDLLTYKCLLQNQKKFTITQMETIYLNLRGVFDNLNNKHTFYTEENYSVHCNCIEFIKGFKKQMDFVYFDPPWGGSNYWKKKNMMLFLEYNGEKIPIYKVVMSVFDEGFTKTVIVKIPNNFNSSLFIQQLGKHIKYKFYSVKKKTKNIYKFLTYSILYCYL
jgi:16S rRNA G966 N2-methylase RsmD